ncbi:MAG: hypothetical protein ABUL44_03075 [Flavobacterium sp.]
MSFNDIPATKYWESNGEIVSIPDIERSTITAKFGTIMAPVLHDELIRNSLLASRCGLTLNTLFIDFSGRKLFFQGDAMKNQLLPNGLHTYTIPINKGVAL